MVQFLVEAVEAAVVIQLRPCQGAEHGVDKSPVKFQMLLDAAVFHAHEAPLVELYNACKALYSSWDILPWQI